MYAQVVTSQEAADTMTSRVYWITLAAGIVCLVAGLIFLALEYRLKFQAAKKASKGEVAIDPTKPTEQAGIPEVIESVGKLATALKDLDMGTRTLVISVTFFAVAAVAAGLDSIASAIAK